MQNREAFPRPFSTTRLSPMREPKLNMFTLPVQTNSDHFQIHTPSVPNHINKVVMDARKDSAPRSSNTSEMPSTSNNGKWAISKETECTNVKAPVGLLSHSKFLAFWRIVFRFSMHFVLFPVNG